MCCKQKHKTCQTNYMCLSSEGASDPYWFYGDLTGSGLVYVLTSINNRWETLSGKSNTNQIDIHRTEGVKLYYGRTHSRLNADDNGKIFGCALWCACECECWCTLDTCCNAHGGSKCIFCCIHITRTDINVRSWLLSSTGLGFGFSQIEYVCVSYVFAYDYLISFVYIKWVCVLAKIGLLRVSSFVLWVWSDDRCMARTTQLRELRRDI